VLVDGASDVKLSDITLRSAIRCVTISRERATRLVLLVATGRDLRPVAGGNQMAFPLPRALFATSPAHRFEPILHREQLILILINSLMHHLLFVLFSCKVP
jgi:hypothetical protein